MNEDLTEPIFPPEARLVLVASTGGHLEQLHRWATRWGIASNQLHWVTFSNEQSRSLLAGSNVTFVDYVRPRDVVGTLRTVRPIRDAAMELRATAVVSTGAAVAVSAAIASRVAGVPFTYIESLARVDRLSMTARILMRFPRIRRFVQSERLSSRSFKHAGSILDDFRTETVTPRAHHERLRVFVTVGTIRPYGFDRLLEAVDRATVNDEVYWQTGESQYQPTHGTVIRAMPRAELIEHLEASDVVVAHAGVGSILSSLAAGRVPLVAARSKKYGEHIDDHQLDIANLLAHRGLVKLTDIHSLTRDDLVSATGLTSKADVSN
ncbi:glycosyltransferase [Microbacterium radiodurans]|uniref:Glycosyltransferase n=1 Tax=Microbacterium radiodurans TaxID=661398 RepID=A0A5J5IN98_9MICO|nr:glycosyltransferase [Microbacterium radiodurans]KAA9084153.1 glycosyltransferase [Microbacterium radiodurans]